jgi:hypothetical protein
MVLPNPKVLIHCVHYPTCAGRFLARAFERIGCDVRTMGYCIDEVWGILVSPGDRWQPNPPGEGWQPDLIIAADTNGQLTGGYSGPHIAVGVDNHVLTYEQAQYDHLFLSHQTGPRLPVSDGMTWLPCGYDPVWHTNRTPLLDRPHDLAFCGVGYPARQTYFEALIDAGFSIALAIGLFGVGYTDFYNDAKVSLCISLRGDVAMRIFECAAMGNVILSDRCQDFPALGFLPDIHYLPVDNPDHATRQLQWVLDNPSEAARIAQNAQAWVHSQAWDNRANTILDWLVSYA